MMIGKLFDKYEVNFPVENDLSIITGMNGTGKTQTLLLLKKYFEEQGENVLYFPADRKSNVTIEDLDAFEVMYALSSGESLLTKYDLKSPLMADDLAEVYGDYIRSGFVQIANFYCNIMKAKPNTIVLIDTPERSLHVLIKRHLINDLIKMQSVKKLIVVTHCPEILGSYWDNNVDIENCVKLWT